MYNLHCTCMWTILSFNEEINDKLNQNYHMNVKKHRISGWGLPSMLLNYTECDVSISKLLGFETFPFFKWSRIRQKTWSQKIYWDPRMFWDDIKIMLSSRDWWDPGILQDGTSSCRDLVEFFGSKTNQSFWSHYLFNTLNPPQKTGILFFNFNHGIPGYTGIPQGPGQELEASLMARLCKPGTDVETIAN